MSKKNGKSAHCDPGMSWTKKSTWEGPCRWRRVRREGSSAPAIRTARKRPQFRWRDSSFRRNGWRPGNDWRQIILQKNKFISKVSECLGSFFIWIPTLENKEKNRSRKIKLFSEIFPWNRSSNQPIKQLHTDCSNEPDRFDFDRRESLHQHKMAEFRAESTDHDCPRKGLERDEQCVKRGTNLQRREDEVLSHFISLDWLIDWLTKRGCKTGWSNCAMSFREKTMNVPLSWRE